MVAMSKEHYEQLEPSQKATWFAGLFEVAGSLGFYKSLRGGRVVTYPQIQYGEKDINQLLVLQNVFGGAIGFTKPNSSAWAAVSSLAKKIAGAIEQYSVSRRQYASLVNKWDSMNDDEKLHAIDEFRTDRPSEFPSPEAYQEAVKDNQFVAGIIDARGKISAQRKRIRVSIPNRSLLEALSERYGGGIYVAEQVNESLMIKGRSAAVHRPIFSWAPNVIQTRALASDIRNCVLFRYDEIKALLKESEETSPVPLHDARRLAYLLEEKGSMSFYIRKHTSGEAASYPRIRIRSDGYLFLLSLRNDFGGNIYYDHIQHMGEWMIQGESAARLGMAISPWSHRLPDTINHGIHAFTAWADEETISGKYAIAQQFKK